MKNVYHGTRVPFSKGGYVMPPKFHEGAGTTAPVSPGRTPPKDAGEFVYVTTSKVLAWVYAWHAPGTARPRVCTVAPIGEFTRDPEHSTRMQAYRCEMAKVLSVDLDPLVSEADARAGWEL